MEVGRSWLFIILLLLIIGLQVGTLLRPVIEYRGLLLTIGSALGQKEAELLLVRAGIQQLEQRLVACEKKR